MRARFTLLALLVAALGQGCFLIAETDQFVDDEACDLELDVRAFAPHLGQLFEVRLVQDPPESLEASRPRLLVLAIFDPLEGPDLDIDIPGAVPPLTDPTQPRPVLDFYADFDDIPGYSGPPGDHTWRVADDLCDPDRDPGFPHNTDFVDLPMPIGGGSDVFIDFCPNLTTGDRIGPLDAFDGTEPVEVRVSGIFPPLVDGMAEEKRPVGYYRLGSLADSRAGIRIPAVFDNGFRYTIEVIVDRNSDYAFDDEDQGWIYTFAGLASAPDCEPIADSMTCGLSAETVNESPACKDGADIRVRLSRTHVANFGDPLDTRWVSLVEGT